MRISNFQGMIIDMDGVLWRGHTILQGVREFFICLRGRSMQFILATNNSTVTPESVVERLAQWDIAIAPEEVLTSSLATAAYLQSQFPEGTRMLAIGETALKSALLDAGFKLSDRIDGVEVVVSGFDRHVSWEKLTRAALAIQSGAHFIGTNPDKSFPIEQGQAPGNGAFLAALEATTGVVPFIIGKPEPRLFEQAAARMDLPANHILTVGDRLDTDILGGQRAGMPTALMLSGVTTAEDAAASEIKPDWIFENLPALTHAIQGA